MNEKQWKNERRDAVSMVYRLRRLGLLRRVDGRRKFRLFACGCSHLAWDRLVDQQLKNAVDVGERFADGERHRDELTRTYDQLISMDGNNRYHYGDFRRLSRERRAAMLATVTCHARAFDCALIPTVLQPSPITDRGRVPSDRLLCDLLRCVFGNPFRKPAFPKAWRTEAVTALASAIYAERAFDRLPILADAIQEAGCDDPAMLNHLRGPGPHCRGCWVLDLALGM